MTIFSDVERVSLGKMLWHRFSAPVFAEPISFDDFAGVVCYE